MTVTSRLVSTAQVAAARGEWQVVVSIGCDLLDRGDFVEASALFLRAVAAGEKWAAIYAGNSMVALGQDEQAVGWFRRAIDWGDAEAWFNLARALERLDDRDTEVDEADRRAMATGDAKGGIELAFRIRARGNEAQAVEVLEECVNGTGDSLAAAILACWRWDSTQDVTLEASLREGADLFPSARADLAELLVNTGRPEAARDALLEGVAASETESFLPLANLLEEEFGDLVAAERYLRLGAKLGDSFCHHNLGLLLLDQGRDEEARREFALGESLGDSLAAAMLNSEDLEE